MAKTWWGAIAGEMSKLRNKFVGTIGGSVGSAYTLDSSRVDYELAKQLYFNTNDDYKLGAGFAKTIINNTVSFMGVPSYKNADKNAQSVLETFVKENLSNMQRTTRDALRDGDCFVWITRESENDLSLYPEKPERLVYTVIPPASVSIKRNALTNEPEEYAINKTVNWKKPNGSAAKCEITQRIRIREIEVEAKGDIPPDLEIGKKATPWDFLPIIHFKNEGDEGEFGQSDLEPIEPFLKAYHDVMMHAMQGSKMHSTPRLKFQVKNVSNFLFNNFGIDDHVKFKKDGGTIDLDGHEFLILEKEDDASFIEVRSATGDAKELLKLLFYCIVDTSETPEFVFGVHTPSSLSSVKEQMPILIRAIERKREHFADSWKRLARIVLAMHSKAENVTFGTFATDLKWVNIDARTSQEISEELLNVVNALKTALEANIIGEESAVNYLSKIIDTMNMYESDDGEGEKERILKTQITKLKMPDAESLEKELAAINKIIQKRGVA